MIEIDFYYKIYEAFSEPLIHEKKNIEELNFVDVICKYENIIKNYKENLKDVKIDGYHFNTQDELYRNILYWGSIFSAFVGFCVREIAVTYKDFITKIYKSIADQESLGMMSEEVNFLITSYRFSHQRKKFQIGMKRLLHLKNNLL